MIEKLIDVLICEPEQAEISEANFDEDKYLLREKMMELISDLSLVSSILLWEILNFLNLNSWSNEHFNFDKCIEKIEASKNLVCFTFYLKF